MSMPGAQATGHRYPKAALTAALVRAGLGVAVCAAIVIGSRGEAVLLAIGLALAAIFAAYGLRAALRDRQAVILSKDALAILGPLPRRLAWNELTQLRLAYYTTRRDGENGWMELRLRSGRTRMTLESELDGFAEIAFAGRDAAESLGLRLSSATMRNYAHLTSGAPRASRQSLREAASGR
jgi:hypothetical protein